jgi:hypothetical protein|tara:strand:+ start:1817 stop:2071 length:255 start_codon:yes stop_codon:yes gene_type:complete
MNWDSVHISDKIHWLKDVVMNSTTYKDGDELIINALITGSQNTFSGEMGFDIQPHHMKFMRELWDEHIETQKDDSIIIKLREKS